MDKSQSLLGSTKGTVSLIRKRSYWNFSNLKPRDPVILAFVLKKLFKESRKSKEEVEREKAKIRGGKKKLKQLLSRQTYFQ